MPQHKRTHIAKHTHFRDTTNSHTNHKRTTHINIAATPQTQTHAHTHTLPQSHTHTHTLLYTHAHTRTHTLQQLHHIGTHMQHTILHTRTQTRACTHTHTHMRARTHTHARAHTHARVHTLSLCRHRTGPRGLRSEDFRISTTKFLSVVHACMHTKRMEGCKQELGEVAWSFEGKVHNHQR